MASFTIAGTRHPRGWESSGVIWSTLMLIAETEEAAGRVRATRRVSISSC